MRVLMFGGTGFVGTAVARQARERGHTVVTVSRSSEADSRVDARTASVQEIARVIEGARPDVVLNLVGAGLSGERLSEQELEQVNAIWPQTLTRAVSMAGEGTLVHVSSSTELTRDPSGAFESQYSSSKSIGTASVITEAHAAGVPLGLVVLHNTYGPGQPAKRLIQWMINQARTSSPIELQFPNRIRDFIYIDDAALALAMALEDVYTYNDHHVGTGVGLSIADAARLVLSACGKSLDMVRLRSASEDFFRETVAPDALLVNASARPFAEGIRLTLNSGLKGPS